MNTDLLPVVLAAFRHVGGSADQCPRCRALAGLAPLNAHDYQRDDVPAILRSAAAYIANHGWHQGSLYADTGVPLPAACVFGAITVATFGKVGDLAVLANDEPVFYLRRFLHARDAFERITIRRSAAWNDDVLDDGRPARTPDRVIAALLTAANQAESTADQPLGGPQ